jgi:hypothetical protein
MGCTSANQDLIVDGYDLVSDPTLHTGTFPISTTLGPTPDAYDTWPSWTNATTSTNSGFPNTVAYMDCATNGGDPMCDCCTYNVYGCTDNNANNYDAGANTDDGSCTYEGCPNATANNYWLNTITPTPLVYAGAGCTTNGTWTLGDDTPTQNGGCCTYPLAGCTDASACNYNQWATSDDGSCCTSNPCETCQEATAFNYDSTGCISTPGLCVYQGCTDSGTVDLGGSNPSPFPNVAAWNYLLTYTIDGNGDDILDQSYVPAAGWNSNCEYQGCADTDATNYSSNNTGCEDAGSLDPADVDCCNYNVGCSDSTANNYTDSSNLSPAFLIDCNGSVPPYLQVAFGSSTLLSVTGENYVDTINDLSFDANDNNDCCEIISGCTDDDADNYDATAGVDDGSCEYLIGCTDPGYSNSITTGYGSSTSATPIACNTNGTTTGVFGPYGNETGYLPGDTNYTGNPDCCEMFGCTDQGLDPGNQTMPGDYATYVSGVGAINYDNTATVDDGSCNYLIYGCNDNIGGAINTVAGAGGCIDENFYLGLSTYNTHAGNAFVVAFDTSDPNWCCTYPNTDNYVICEGSWNGNQALLDSPSPGTPGWGNCSSSLPWSDPDVQAMLALQTQTGVTLVWDSPDGAQSEYPSGTGNMFDDAYVACMTEGCGDCLQTTGVPAIGCVYCELGVASQNCASSTNITIMATAFADTANYKFFNNMTDCQGDDACYIERFGCTDSIYCEYYTQAIHDGPASQTAGYDVWTNQASHPDGSCNQPIVFGCSDPLSSGGGTAAGTCDNVNPSPTDPYDTGYDPYASAASTPVFTAYSYVYQGNGTDIDISAVAIAGPNQGQVGYPINWLDPFVTPNFVAAGNMDCEYDCEDGQWESTLPASFAHVYAKMGAVNPSPNFGNNNSCFACDGANCEEFGPGDEAALDTFLINMWAAGNPSSLTFYNTLGECNANSSSCGQSTYCADDGTGSNPIYDTVRATAGPNGTTWPATIPACNYDPQTATPGLSCPCQGAGGGSSPECCCEYVTCLACADPLALNEGERCDQTLSASNWLVQNICIGTGPGNVLLGGTNPCCYDKGCTDPTAGPNPDINGNDSNGNPCPSPLPIQGCPNGYAATNFDPIACQDNPNAPCEYNTDPDWDCIDDLCTEVAAGTGTYDTVNQCIASGCGADRWACVEYKTKGGPVKWDNVLQQVAEQTLEKEPSELEAVKKKIWGTNLTQIEKEKELDKWLTIHTNAGSSTTFDCCENDPLGPHETKQDCIDNSVCDDCTAIRWKCVLDPQAGTATGYNCVETVAADPVCIAGNCTLTENHCIQTGCEDTEEKWICTMTKLVKGDKQLVKENVNLYGPTKPCVKQGYIGYDTEQECCDQTPCCEEDPCFIYETLIKMEDNTQKMIGEIKVGDKVANANGSTSEVVELHTHEGSYEIYGFNGEKAFVTEEHPMLTDSGWKAINPCETKAKHGIEAATLMVGDYLLKDNEERVLIESIEKNEETVDKVYHISLWEIDTHYANDYVVHNALTDNTQILSIKGWEDELNEYYGNNELTLLNEDPNEPPGPCPKGEYPCPSGCNEGKCCAQPWCGSPCCGNAAPPAAAGCEHFENTVGGVWNTCSTGFVHGDGSGPCVRCCPPSAGSLGVCLNTMSTGSQIGNVRGKAPNGTCCIRQAFWNYSSMGSGGCHATDWTPGALPLNPHSYGTSGACDPQVCSNDWTTSMPCNGYNAGGCGNPECDPFPGAPPQPGGGGGETDEDRIKKEKELQMMKDKEKTQPKPEHYDKIPRWERGVSENSGIRVKFNGYGIDTNPLFLGSSGEEYTYDIISGDVFRIEGGTLTKIGNFIDKEDSVEVIYPDQPTPELPQTDGGGDIREPIPPVQPEKLVPQETPETKELKEQMERMKKLMGL